jgi:cell division protein FtsW
MRLSAFIQRPERAIFPAVLALCAFGLVMVYSSSAVLGIAVSGSPAHFFEAQIPKLIVGLALLLLFWRIDYHHLGGRAAWAGIILSFGSLGGILLLGGFRWVRIGSFSVQPSEFARIALIVFLASYLSRKERLLDARRSVYLVPALVSMAIAGLVALQPNMSMAVLIGLLAIGILFVAGLPARWLLILAGVAACAALVVMKPYQWGRIFAFVGRGGASAEDYQKMQSLTAVGSGGVSGLGIGNGLQKYFFLPYPHTDFILGIVGEETGLIGITLLLGVYGFLIVMGVRCARRARDQFGALLAAGITWNLAMNVIVHGCVNLGLGPVTGVPLPFLSCGGSSLMANLLAMGILLSVARRTVSGPARDWSGFTGNSGRGGIR